MSSLDTEKRILDLPAALSPALLDEAVSCFAARYSALDCGTVGRSMLDRPLHRLALGRGSPAVIYLGGQSGGDAVSSALLGRFVNEYCEQHSRGGRLYGITLSYLAALRRIQVLPMLNPDGISYALEGVAEDHFLRPRLLSMNGGRDDFSAWQANARGIDLRRNYAADAEDFMRRKQAADSTCSGGAPSGWCGEAAESEPESGALGRFLRSLPDAAMLIELRCGEERILLPHDADRRTAALGRTLGRLCGAPTAHSDGGELCDWSAALGVPGFIVYCGVGGGVFARYAALREMLFTAPTLVGK